jgi:LPXTG-site transpeptidase (sortase) family protein
LWELFKPRPQVIPPTIQPKIIVKQPVKLTPVRDADNFHQTKVIPQTGAISEEMMKTYGAYSPFTDLSMGDEDFYATLAMYLQGVVRPSAGSVDAAAPLTGDYVAELLERSTGLNLGVKTSGVINFAQARASVEHVLNMNLRNANAVPNDLRNSMPETSITKGDFHEMLYRSLTAQDNGEGVYFENVHVKGLGMSVNAKRVVLSNPEGWLPQLEDGAGFYQDVREGQNGRIVLFGHSSRYSFMNNTNTEFAAMVDADVVGKTITLGVNGQDRNYRITSKEKVNETDVDSLKNVAAGEDLTIFTCDYPDVSERWVYHAELVQ